MTPKCIIDFELLLAEGTVRSFVKIYVLFIRVIINGKKKYRDQLQKNSTIELIHCTAVYNPVAEVGKLSIFPRFVLVRVTRSMTREYNNANRFLLY